MRKPNRASKPLNITIPPRLREALDRYVDASEVKASRLISSLLRSKLASLGHIEPEAATEAHNVVRREAPGELKRHFIFTRDQ